MKVYRTQTGDAHWASLRDFAYKCSWVAGKHLAGLMDRAYFQGWETVFVAEEDGKPIGYCTFMKEDYYPENRYSPWISCLFVDENHRGKRVSHALIAEAIRHAQKEGFHKVYIPSDIEGFYEKCGFTKIDTLVNYGGDTDNVFAKEI